MKTITLEDWSIVNRDPYTAPELQDACLQGKVTGHPSFDDGARVTTSHIEKLDGGLIVTHTGRKYVLGSVDAEYESLYPNAKERLMKSLETRS